MKLLLFVVLLSSLLNADKYFDAKNSYWDGKKDKAVKIWKKLAEEGDARAQYDYASNIDTKKKGNKKQFKYWLDKSVKQNYANAQYAMVTLYSYGIYGYKKDIKKANELLTLAANQNYSPALSSLAGKYLTGENGYKKDINKAKELYKKAFEINLTLSKGGDPEAQLDLAQNYYNGLGVKKDLKEAKYWFEKAKVSHKKANTHGYKIALSFLQNL